MSAGGDVVIVILVLGSILGLAYWWHQRKIRRQQESFIAWASDRIKSTNVSRYRTMASSIGSTSEDGSDTDISGLGGRVRVDSRLSENSDSSYASVYFEESESNRTKPLYSITPYIPDHDLTTWENNEMGLKINYPRSWKARPKDVSENILSTQILIEFAVPRKKSAYMQLSIAFDDACWTPKLSPRVFARQVATQLHNTLPGSQILRDNQVGKGPAARVGAHEILYTVPDRDGHTLAILNYFYVGNTRAFTVSFSCELNAFDHCENLAHTLLGSFQIKPLAHLVTKETSMDPGKIVWKSYVFDPITEVEPDSKNRGSRQSAKNVTCSLIYPAQWKRHSVPNPRVIRFCCARGEKSLKIINYFIVDMSFLGEAGAEELLSELKQFYEQEVQGQGVKLAREVRVQAGEIKSGIDGPFCAFQTESRQGFVNLKSRVFLGLHGPMKSVGHIITVSVSADIFNTSAALSQHVFREFQKTN